METHIHSYRMTILESHLDTFSHVNNAVYLSILEQARWDLITQRGYGLEKIRETGLGPVILEIQIKFQKELKLRQEIVIETQLRNYETRIATLYQEIKSENNTVHCTAELRLALFDTHKRKLVMPNPEWLRALGISAS